MKTSTAFLREFSFHNNLSQTYSGPSSKSHTGSFTYHMNIKQWMTSVQSSPPCSFTLIVQKSWQFNEFTVFLLISSSAEPSCQESRARHHQSQRNFWVQWQHWKWCRVKCPVTGTFPCSPEESELVYNQKIIVMQLEYLTIIFSNLKITIQYSKYYIANTNSRNHLYCSKWNKSMFIYRKL